MSFNDEQIQFLNKFLVKIYNCDMGKDNFAFEDGRGMSFEEQMTQLYNNDMKTYFQKLYIDEAETIGYMFSSEIAYGDTEFTNEYERLFGELDGIDIWEMPEMNIVQYCESLDLEKLFIILEEAIGTDLFELYDMYEIDYAQPK